MHVQTASYQPARDGDAHRFLEGLGGAPDVVLAFGAHDLAEGGAPVLAALERRFAGAALLGCSTAGEIHGAEIHDGSLSLALLTLERTHARAAAAPIGGLSGSYTAGRSIAEQLAESDLRCVLLLSDGLNVHNSAIVAGLRDHLPSGAVLAGGFAGDAARFASTWVLHAGAARSGWVTAVGLYGPHIGMTHGCDDGLEGFGAERVATQARDNVLYELDGRPALQVYKEYLGPFAADLPGSGLLFPFSMRADESSTRSLVRSVIAVDEAAQSMTVIGDIPTGSLLRLMRANHDKVVAAAGRAAAAAAPRPGWCGDALSLVVSCVGRRLVLGDRTEEETEASLAALPAGVQQVGFYSFGELVPHVHSVCDLHNQTITITTLTETA